MIIDYLGHEDMIGLGILLVYYFNILEGIKVMVKVPFTNELASSLLSHGLSDSRDLKTDPRGYIFSRFNYDISDGIDLSVAENGGIDMHLTLPYYSALDGQSAQIVDDELLDDISGGWSFYPSHFGGSGVRSPDSK